MPENVSNLFSKLSPEMTGAIMAMFIAALRVVYDRKETKPLRILLESLICGALSLTVGSAIIALGMNSAWSIFLGGVIGFMGSMTVRGLAVKFIHGRIDSN